MIGYEILKRLNNYLYNKRECNNILERDTLKNMHAVENREIQNLLSLWIKGYLYP
jgi:hypothetical protein